MSPRTTHRERYQKAIHAFATAVVKKRLWFVIAFALLFSAGVVGFFFVNTNYDSTAYLPNDSEIKQGLQTMYDEFGENGNTSVMIKKDEDVATVSYEESIRFKREALRTEGVSSILWLDDLFGTIVKGTDTVSQTEQEEGLLFLLSLTEKIDIASLLQDPAIQALLRKTDVSDPEKVDDLCDMLFVLFKDTIEKELSSGKYSFAFDRANEVVKSDLRVLLSSGLLNDVNISETDVSGLNEIVSGFQTSVKMFYTTSENGETFPLFQVSFSKNDYAKETMDAIEEIRSLGGKSGYSVHMSGNAATTYNSINCVETQTLYALIAVGGVVLVILFLFSTSFWEPVLYLIAIGVAVIINMGSNVLLESVSYLTSGVAGILQMALSMDYSIFILTRYKQEKEKTMDPEEAMIHAVKASLSPIGASSLTTIASFVAIMFMSYSIGLDMGIVFAKGVVLSLLSVFMLLPGLAVYTDKLIVRSEHKTFRLTFNRFTGTIIKGRKIIPFIAIAIIVVACVGQYYMKFGYGDTATFGSEGSLIYKDKREIESVFGRQNQLAVLIERTAAEKIVTTDGGVDSTAETEITKELSAKEYVLTAQSAGVIKESGLNEILPEAFMAQFDKGGNYKRMVLYLDLDEEGERTEQAIGEIRAFFEEYGVGTDSYYMLGGSSSAIEIKNIVNVDYRRITWVSVALILVILFITFRNAIIPFLLIFVIQGSVWISMSISVLTGDVLVFLGYLIVSAVMLGATIDYGILLTSNYLEARKSFGKRKAIEVAVGKSTRAILTSSLILCAAGIVITLTSTMPAIVVFGELIARTAATSLVLVFTLLPCLLVIFDKVIEKTTFNGVGFIKQEEEGQRNVVFIGMPSCGKSTIGKLIAERNGMPFYDTDEEIVKREGRSIPEIFAKEGENYFRDVESEVAKELSEKRGVVISCGGGMVLREQNAKALRENGTIIFIKRKTELLSTEGRPLSKDRETLKKMKKIRFPLYKKYSDYTITNNDTIEKAVKKTEKLL